jgi:hypothetical protein
VILVIFGIPPGVAALIRPGTASRVNIMMIVLGFIFLF